MTSPELFEEFYENFGKKYTEISLEEMKLICSSPFQMMKEKMLDGNLEEIRIQHMFVARVSQARVIKHLESLYHRREKGNITIKTFDRGLKMLMTHINNNKVKFIKHEQRIKKITSREIL